MSVSCERCVLSGRGLCDGLITRPEESYRVWCVWESSRELNGEEAQTQLGLSMHPPPKKKFSDHFRGKVWFPHTWKCGSSISFTHPPACRRYPLNRSWVGPTICLYDLEAGKYLESRFLGRIIIIFNHYLRIMTLVKLCHFLCIPSFWNEVCSPLTLTDLLVFIYRTLHFNHP